MSGCDTSTTKKKCMPVHTTLKEVKCRRKIREKERKKERKKERQKERKAFLT